MRPGPPLHSYIIRSRRHPCGLAERPDDSPSPRKTLCRHCQSQECDLALGPASEPSPIRTPSSPVECTVAAGFVRASDSEHGMSSCGNSSRKSAVAQTIIAAILPRETFWISGTILCAFGVLSSHPVRILTVTERLWMLAVSADTMSTSLLGLSIRADPAPRSHTTSIGQPQFRSIKSVCVSSFRICVVTYTDRQRVLISRAGALPEPCPASCPAFPRIPAPQKYPRCGDGVGVPTQTTTIDIQQA